MIIIMRCFLNVNIVRLYYSNVDYKGEIDGEVVDDIFDGLIYAG